MRITILVDNRLSDSATEFAPNASVSTAKLQNEHGLSLFITTDDGEDIICDTGASGLFLENAQKLGIDPQIADFAFISHAHNDHTGGLKALLAAYDDIPIFMSINAFKYNCYSNRQRQPLQGSNEPNNLPNSSNEPNRLDGLKMRDISIDQSILKDYPYSSIRYIDHSQWVTDSIAVICNGTKDKTSKSEQTSKYNLPIGNRHLYKKPINSDEIVLDDFDHEMSLAIKTLEGLIIISSCTHSGAANIIKDCIDFTGQTKIRAFVGGLHLVNHPDVKEEALAVLHELTSLYPEMKIITGHCTCDEAIKVMEENSPMVSHFYTGLSLDF